MLWQQVILLQIVAGSVLTLWSRRISIEYSKYLFSIFLTVYVVVALSGVVITLVANNGSIPVLPDSLTSIYIIAEGLLIPLSWLFSYKLLSIIGASSMAIAQSLNLLVTASLGLIILGEPLSTYIIIGAVLLVSGVTIVLGIQNSKDSRHKVGLPLKIILLILSSITLAFGLLFEKLAIDGVGVWSYAFYGWGAQLIGAILLFILFGRSEVNNTFTLKFWKHAGLAGLLTALSGSLFIYSLSKGLLSSVVLASSAKIIFTSLLAFWILYERNDIRKKLLAMFLAIMGLIVIFIS